MTGPNLPVNVDAVYADDPGDASKKLHQQHHDAIHARVNILDKDTAPFDGAVYVYSAGTGTFVPTAFSGAGGAPAAATYVTMAAEAGLSAESVLGTAVIMAGATGARPGFATAGRLYADTTLGILYRDSGAAWVSIGVGTGYGAAVDIANIAATEQQGISLLLARADHVHAHDAGYLPDAHHTQVHNSTDHSDAYAASLAGLRALTGPVTYTISGGDGVIVCDATAGDITINLPAITATTTPPAAGSVGTVFVIIRKDSSNHDVALVPNGTDTINTDTHLSGINQRVGLVADTTAGAPFSWDPIFSHRGPEIVMKNADQTKSNTVTLADDTHLVIHAVSGKVYSITGRLMVESSAVADFKVTVTAPGSSTGGWTSGGVSGNQAFDQVVGTSLALLAFGTSRSFGGGGAAAYTMVAIEAIVVAGEDGLITVQWAQDTAEVSNTILHKGSFLSFTRV